MQKRKVGLSFLVVIMMSICSLYGQVSFFAYADAKEMLIGEYVEVTFTVKNADGGKMSTPRFPGFQILKGPTVSVGYEAVVGEPIELSSFSYIVSPKKLGVLTIPPVTFTYKNKTYNSNPIPIKVVKERAIDPKESIDDDAAVKALIDATDVWVGQQLNLDYKVFVAGNVMKVRPSAIPDFTGFYYEDLGDISSLGLDFRPRKEVINGREYYTEILRRFAIYPQEAGQLTIDPFSAKIGIPKKRRRPNFFSPYIMEERSVMTKAITLNVKSLPPAPDNFSGAVGRFIARFYTNHHKKRISTDDSFSIGLQVRGSGDGKRIQPPKLNLPPGFDVYDPTVRKEQFFSDEEGKLLVQKEFEFIIVPNQPGNYTLQPSFTYFDVDSSAYVTIANESFQLDVFAGSAKPNIEGKENQTIAATKKDIKGIKKGDIALTPIRHSFFGSIGFFVLAVIPFLFVGVGWFLKRKQQAVLGLDPKELKKRQARKVALNRLSNAKKHLDEENSKAFFDEISKAMLGYICDKLQIPTSDLTKANVADKLRSINVPEDLIATYNEIIKNSEIALYAGMDNAHAMQNTYDKTTQLLTEIEEL